jgi:lipopolysaccharide/colanic/teichoic acid biosynthesis glycosyltransferase
MKFIFDRIMALLGIIILIPLFLIISILIKVKTPGPIFFTQKRVGRKGKLFSVIKFRTMKVSHKGSTISIAGESRITKLGAVLRRTKVDELPALCNVLIGDMSFVGPRPDVQGYADCLIGEDRKILNLRPGITGPASLKYSNEEQILAKVENPKEYNDKIIYPDKVKINLDYYYNNSFVGDSKIIINTIFKTNL